MLVLHKYRQNEGYIELTLSHKNTKMNIWQESAKIWWMYKVWTFEKYWFLQVLGDIWKEVLGTFWKFGILQNDYFYWMVQKDF